jgi:hypothetical protein
MALNVNQQSEEVGEMACEWPILEALMGGTPAMRAAGYHFLPKWPNEEQASYDCRLKVATLLPAYQRTVTVMSGKPFSKQITLSKDTPPEIVEWCNDIDKEGINLHTFAAEMFQECFYGLAGILVEAPKPITISTGRDPTEAEQKAAGIRPYWVRIKHSQLLGWILKTVNGAKVLTQLRIAETAKVPDGEYGEKSVPQVRVLTPGKWELQEKRVVNGKEAWVIVDSGTTGLTFIPFVPLYGMRKAFMCGAPPLRDLAYLNVKHWQSQSDQDTILHVARVPILFAKLLGDSGITVGASTAIKADDKDADVKFVEHTGKAIEAGKASLEALEEQMLQTGAELLMAKPGQRTATEDSNDAEANKCDLQRMVEGFEDSLDLALYYTAQYKKLPAGGTVSLFKDFASFSLTDASAQLVLGMQAQGLISKPTAIREQQRRGNLSPDIDPDKELQLVGEEGPAPGTLVDNSGA